MKLFFISDIHGSKYHLEKVMAIFEKSSSDYLIVLGDILYHGARNPLPKGYDPKGVIEILNSYKDKIIAVRGNCDSEVDQMVLDFPIWADYSNVIFEGRRLFLSHGHIYNEEDMVDLREGSAFIYGHTHLPRAELVDGVYFINPGSISLPKKENPNSYGIFEAGIFQVRDFDGNIIEQVEME